LHADEQRARVAQDVEDVFADVMAEGVHFGVSEGTGDEVEGEVEVGEREEGEEELDELVHEFDVQQDFAPDGVVGCPYLFEVQQGVDGGEEGAVKPSSTLGNELGDGVYDC
jgi:hypothetical protein